jgi:hypothetical protein
MGGHGPMRSDPAKMQERMQERMAHHTELKRSLLSAGKSHLDHLHQRHEASVDAMRLTCEMKN